MAEPTQFYRSATPTSEDIREFIAAEFERARGRRPQRVEVVFAPHEVGVIIYLDEVNDEDRDFIAKLEQRLSEAGQPAIVTGAAGTGLSVG